MRSLFLFLFFSISQQSFAGVRFYVVTCDMGVDSKWIIHQGLRAVQLDEDGEEECAKEFHFGPRNGRPSDWGEISVINAGCYHSGYTQEPKFAGYVENAGMLNVREHCQQWAQVHPVYSLADVNCWRMVYAVLHSFGLGQAANHDRVTIIARSEKHLINCRECIGSKPLLGGVSVKKKRENKDDDDSSSKKQREEAEKAIINILGGVLIG